MKKFYGYIDDKGKFNANLIKSVKQHLATLKGKEIEIRIGKKKSSRSIEQNSLYWLWLTELEMWSGQDKEDWHIFFKGKFLKMRDKKIPYLKSTTELNPSEFIEYLDKIENWMLGFDNNFHFPHPADLYN